MSFALHIIQFFCTLAVFWFLCGCLAVVVANLLAYLGLADDSCGIKDREDAVLNVVLGPISLIFIFVGIFVITVINNKEKGKRNDQEEDS